MSITDANLTNEARSLMNERYELDRHQVGSALVTTAGQVFTGIHVEASCGRISLCAEAVAIGAAATAGDTQIERIVAVTESGDVIPPCGMCRELISDYSPEALVILNSRGDLRTVPVRELLPERIDLSSLPNRREG